MINKIEHANHAVEMENSYLVIHQQNRLDAIIHAINCSTNRDSCSSCLCRETTLTLIHASTCRSSKCNFDSCSEVTFLIDHWITCTDWHCHLCRFIWESKKDDEYETKFHNYNRVTSVATAILDMSELDPGLTRPVIQQLVNDIFADIEYAIEPCELEEIFDRHIETNEEYYYDISTFVLGALEFLEESWEDLSDQPVSFWKGVACDKFSYIELNM